MRYGYELLEDRYFSDYDYEDTLYERAFCEGYEYAQKEFGKRRKNRRKLSNGIDMTVNPGEENTLYKFIPYDKENIESIKRNGLRSGSSFRASDTNPVLNVDFKDLKKELTSDFNKYIVKDGITKGNTVNEQLGNVVPRTSEWRAGYKYRKNRSNIATYGVFTPDDEYLATKVIGNGTAAQKLSDVDGLWQDTVEGRRAGGEIREKFKTGGQSLPPAVRLDFISKEGSIDAVGDLGEYKPKKYDGNFKLGENALISIPKDSGLLERQIIKSKHGENIKVNNYRLKNIRKTLKKNKALVNSLDKNTLELILGKNNPNIESILKNAKRLK